jgi:hypothetical protein
MVSDWKDSTVDVISATVGDGSDTVFEMLCEELQFIRMAFRKEFDSEQPKLSDIVNLFYGPDSKIFRVFKDAIKITHVEFIKFMKTFCVQTAYRVLCKEMFDSDSYIDTCSLSTAEYTAIWHHIGKARVPSTVTLWMKLEDALNELQREFLVEVFVAQSSG